MKPKAAKKKAAAPEIFPSKRARAKKIPPLREGQQWVETSEREFRVRNNSPALRYLRALAAKHFSGVEIYAARRKLLISSICNDPAGLPPYQQVLNEAITENAMDFMERLFKGSYEDRKPAFSKTEEALLLKWDDPWVFTFHGEKVRLPGLKWWRDEAVTTLLSKLPDYIETHGGLDLSAYRSIRDRLDIAPEKRKLVKRLEFLRDAKTKKIRDLRVTFTKLQIPEAETPDTDFVIMSLRFNRAG